MVASAVTPALLFSVYFAIVSADRHTDLSLAAIVFLVALIVTGAHVLFLGLPLFFLGLRYHAIHWWTVLPASFLVGYSPCTAYLWLESFDATTYIPFGLLGRCLVGVLGAIGGLTFWLLWHFWVQHTPARPAAAPVDKPPSNGG